MMNNRHPKREPIRIGQVRVTNWTDGEPNLIYLIVHQDGPLHWEILPSDGAGTLERWYGPSIAEDRIISEPDATPEAEP